MADSRTYTVIEADYLDEEEGIVRGAEVTAETGPSDGVLMVTAIAGEALSSPVAVFARQLERAAA